MSDPSAIGTSTALPVPPAGWFDYAYAVLMNGRLGLIRTRSNIHRDWWSWWQAVVAARNAGPEGPEQPDFWSGGIRVSVYDGSAETNVVDLPNGSLIALDRMRDGRWLVACSRDENPDDVRIYSGDGRELRAIDLGGGIQRLLASPDGTIWIGYSEETIFDGPDENGLRPLSSGGIVQFDEFGGVLWSFNDSGREAELGSWARVDDCPSLTLTGSTLWTCLPDHSRRLDDQPSRWVRIVGGTISSWPSDAHGERAIAVADDLVLAAGFDFEEANRLVVVRTDGRLGSFRFNPLVSAGRPLLQYPGDRLQFIYGFDAPKERGPSLLQGRDGVLHIVQGGRWTRISADQALKAVDPLDDVPRSLGPPFFVRIYPPGPTVTDSFGQSFFAPPSSPADRS
ncbi:MAG: hypothetical protein AB7O56_06920 [Bauldia sp.]